jgi:ribosomal protein S18 acetylase RimI-like enzyme
MFLAKACILDLAGTKDKRIVQAISERIKIDLELYPRTCLVVHDGEGLVGFSLTEVTGSCASIFLLAVDSRHRRSGIGSTLVVDTLNRLKDKGVKYVELATPSENESSQTFWISKGFTDAKMRVFSRFLSRRDIHQRR